MPFGRDIKVLSKRFFHAVKGVMPLSAGKWCFSKKLLIADYVIMGVILIVLLALIVGDKNASEWSMVVVAWVAQLAISTGAYYWKAKSENLVKLPIYLLKELPPDMREKADPNSIIASVLGIGTNSN